jgi:type I restriction enzyme S subunit
MTQLITLGEIATINPDTPIHIGVDELCSFVPMDAVEETTAEVSRFHTRPYKEVARGYTSFAENDVLLAKITPCMENGKCAIVRGLRNGIGFGSTEFHVVRGSPQILPEWIYYYWRLPKTREVAERNMTGTAGQKRVPTGFLETLVIPCPPVDRQRELIGLLKAADKLRRIHRYALEMSDDLLPTFFLEIFGDLASNSKGWDTLALGELVVTGPQNGLYKPASSYGTGTPILRIDAFHDGQLGNVRALKRLRLSEAEVIAYLLNPDDVVINRVNSRPYLGKSLLIPRLREPTVFESNMMRFAVDRNRVNPTFLSHQLQTSFVKNQVQVAAKDAVNQASINQEDVESFLIRIPPVALQDKFTKIVDRHARLRATHVEGSRQADHLLQSLLHKAFAS